MATATARKAAAKVPDRTASRKRAATRTRPASSRTAAPARRSPSRSTRRSQVTPIPGRLVAVGVGRTAGAVGGIADSGLVVRLTRGRLWIGALAVLLVGIVALNVGALSLNASSTKISRQADGLERANSALRARLATRLSSQSVEAAAARLGMIVPKPGSLRYLRPGADDAKVAARRLVAGELAAPAVTAAVPVVDTTLAEPLAASEPAPAPAPAVPAAATDPAAAPASEPAAAPPSATGGGVAVAE